MNTQMSTILEVLKTQLEWRGPSGRPQGTITLSRDQANEVLKELTKKTWENGTTQNQGPVSSSKALAKRFLVGQPRRDGTYPQRAWHSYRENDDAD